MRQVLGSAGSVSHCQARTRIPSGTNVPLVVVQCAKLAGHGQLHRTASGFEFGTAQVLPDDYVKTITPKEAFAIVLSDIAVQCHEAIRVKDYARAIVWCEVGLSIVIVDKKVSEIVQEAAE